MDAKKVVDNRLKEVEESLLVPGVIVDVDPDIADQLGLFEETALSLDEALESMVDNPELDKE
jgi:hypothetical protein